MAIFYNQATLNLGGNTINSNVTAGEILAGLAFTKVAASQDYAKGDSITYIVSAVNSGTQDQTGITLTDDLGAFAYGSGTLVPLTYIDGSVKLYVNGAQAVAPTVTSTSPLTFGNVTVPAGGNVIIVYEARVNEFAPLEEGALITNNATLTGVESLTDSAEVPVRDGVALSIAKTLCPTVVTDNGNVTYTFVIQNAGNLPVVATDNLTVTDTFTPALTNVSVTLNGEELTDGVGYNYNTVTGEFATTNGTITVPAAAYTRDAVTGAIITTPGYAVLVVSGQI